MSQEKINVFNKDDINTIIDDLEDVVENAVQKVDEDDDYAIEDMRDDIKYVIDDLRYYVNEIGKPSMNCDDQPSMLFDK